MAINYSVHGSSFVDVEQAILIIEAIGPWNNEFFDSFHQQLGEAIKELKVDTYGALVKPKGEAVIGQDAFEKHLAFLSQAKTSCIAVNLALCDTHQITKSILGKLYTRAGIVHKFFNNDQDAKAWLNSKLDNS
jgi:hypothetical protein